MFPSSPAPENGPHGVEDQQAVDPQSDPSSQAIEGKSKEPNTPAPGAEIALEGLTIEGAKKEVSSPTSCPSVAEFRLVGSYEDLVELYANRGLNFDRSEDLFEQVKKDWDLERKRLFEAAKDKPLPEEFPSVTVELEGIKHNILGCIHTFHVGANYYKVLIESLMKKPWWVHEQNLGTAGLFLPGLESMSLEIDDHNARGLPRRIVSDFIRNWTFPFKELRFSLSRRKMAQHAEQTGISKHFIFEKSLNMPFDAPLEIPSNIDIIRREHLGLGYTMVQLRSAYQAAFFKAWKPEEVHQVSDDVKAKSKIPPETWSEKNILVGAAHAHEIEYFLNHEPKFETHLVERARKDAELYNRDPKAFFRRRMLRNLTEKSISIGLSIGAGWGGVTLLTEGLKLIF